MFKYIVGIIVLIAASAGAYWYSMQPEPPTNPPVVIEPQVSEPVSIVAENLDIPWDIAFLPEGLPGQGGMLVTERTGSLLHIKQDKSVTEVPLKRSEVRGEGGLLGIVLHPNFKNSRFVYLYMSAQAADGTENRVERYRFENSTLSDERLIIGGIPGATYHDGGRMAFGPDGKLYITTGDATRGQIAQDKSSLGGKILRLNDDGSIPSDNPFGNAVWSYGHRNPQGLAWDSGGRLWETEHGPTGEQNLCCRDEINLIEKGGNYGWPVITGDQIQTGMRTPVLHSGAKTVWAPASAVVVGDKMYFGGLLGRALYEVTLGENGVTNLKEHFKNEFGRIRTVRMGPDGFLYLTTSNRDGRGDPVAEDDRIIRVDPKSLD
ncbi:MAG TPA: PQQ-dependent sugar dehydrogenase [Candidatus Paceibacterota bacterium]